MGWFDRFRNRRNGYQQLSSNPRNGDYSSYGNTSGATNLSSGGNIDISKPQNAHPWGWKDVANRTREDYTPNFSFSFRNAIGALGGGWLGRRMGQGIVDRTLGTNAPWQAQAVGNIGGAVAGGLAGGTEWGRANTIGRIPLINRIPGMPNINRYNEEQAQIRQQRTNEDQVRQAYANLNNRDAQTHQRGIEASGMNPQQYNAFFNSAEGQALRAKGYSEEDMAYAAQARSVQNALYAQRAAEAQQQTNLQQSNMIATNERQAQRNRQIDPQTGLYPNHHMVRKGHMNPGTALYDMNYNPAYTNIGNRPEVNAYQNPSWMNVPQQPNGYWHVNQVQQQYGQPIYPSQPIPQEQIQANLNTAQSLNMLAPQGRQASTSYVQPQQPASTGFNFWNMFGGGS